MNYLLILLVALIGTAGAATIDCNNCTDCSMKIQNASIGDTVRLTANIVNCSGHCIDFNDSDGIIFDGGNHSIIGDSEYVGYGIYLSKYSNANTIRNCNLSRFQSGIYMIHSQDNLIQNTTSSGNYGTGVTMLYSTDNVIRDCDLKENCHYDFYLVPYMLCDCDNVVQNVTGSGDHPIGYYNETIHLQDREFSALYLCSADGSEIENVTISGSESRDNNGMRMYSTYGATLTNVTSSDNFEGISIYDSYNILIDGAVCNENHHYNIFLSYGAYNTIQNTITCGSSQAGVYLFHAPNTHLSGITAMNNPIGVMIDQSNYTTMNRSVLKNNRLTGIAGRAYHSQIYDNYFDQNVDVTGTITGRWNITPTPGINIIGGSIIAGNRWSDYNGTDEDRDGIGDTPWIHAGGIDHHPIVSLWLCGDVDGNGYVSVNDAIETYKRSVDPTYQINSMWAADVDGNAYISASDVVRIYMRSVDTSYSLNCTFT